ncbi:MAG: HAD hydrolase-like protein [Clostridia bacterium]|nr:HAD hydrolase-like protein [Clostridia bacterium]
MSKYKYLLFDLDGTILDSFEGVAKSFAYALESYGIHVKDLNELLPILGPPLRDAFMELYGFSEEEAVRAVAKYRERYVHHYVEECTLYDGIIEMLSKLHANGFKIVLATSKPEIFARTLLDHFDISKYFHFITGATMDKSRDSKIQVLEYILSELDLTDKSEACMIGDRKFDLCGANELGLDAVGVLYGFGSFEELDACPHVFLAKSPEELYNYFAD